MAVDPTYNTKNYEKQGGDEWDVGGVLDILSGGALKIAGTDVTPALATAPAAVAAGYKIARGVHTQVAAADTVVTGLATVVAVNVSFRDAPSVKQMFVSGSEGDQAGAPAAGSIIISTWKPTNNTNDSTPTAATDLSENKKIAWEAIGT